MFNSLRYKVMAIGIGIGLMVGIGRLALEWVK